MYQDYARNRVEAAAAQHRRISIIPIIRLRQGIEVYASTNPLIPTLPFPSLRQVRGIGREDVEEMEINIFTAHAPSICPSFVFMTRLLRGRVKGRGANTVIRG